MAFNFYGHKIFTKSILTFPITYNYRGYLKTISSLFP